MPIDGTELQGRVTWDWIGQKSGDGRPVYKGETSSGRKFVLKLESWNLNSSANLADHGDVNVGASQVRRSIAVMAELHQIVAARKPYENRQPFPDVRLVSEPQGTKAALDSLKQYGPNEAFQNAKALLDFNGHSTAAYLMDFLPDVKEFSTKPDTNLGQMTRHIHQREPLLTPTNFRALGKIAAVDLFVGSTDRFASIFTQKPKVTAYNIFTTDLGMVGIDFFDPLSRWSNLYSEHGVDEWTKKDKTRPWPGSLLAEKAQHKRLATAVVSQICGSVGKTKGLSDCVKGFEEGLNAGTEALRQTVANNSWTEKKFNMGNGAPAQLLLRAKALGWV